MDNSMLAEHFGMSSAWEQWLEMFIGTESRHFGFDVETGKRHHTLVDMGTEAGGKALEAAGTTPRDIDLIVMGTATPDQLMPATVNLIADRLGIDDVASFQLQSGCSGALQALDVAHQMLSTGRSRNALVLGAESVAKHYDTNMDFGNTDSSYAVNTLLFGDGAGAAVLSTDPVTEAAVLHPPLVRLVGMGHEPGQVVEWFGAGDRGLHDQQTGGHTAVTEDYRAIENRVPEMANEVLRQLLENLDWDETEFDYLLPPQLSGRMTKAIVDSLSVSDIREISRVREIGNTGNAAPFFQLERALPRMSRSDRAVCISIESSKWIKSGCAVEKV
ncbi:3-oxoacyl-ACP synthase III family protein [Haloactinomyces albus]|uniref:3-oxoacyl-[acyl-carrier-protein] synthase-3 n=1 Tax=Haloactinomyces albus TaxID=1352928 RepID=A0AAE4CN94_9ACTN|nr:3-oxoacyl-ACP synthase III family protein [Haloactinomyces albus]MDR7303669.1 3-oxoacyl-[acyl-carrier-protein] synthase-3 [Haloactinomyces albus]